MSEFFSNYSKIDYNMDKTRPLTTTKSVNILNRVRIRDTVLSNVLSYYPYLVKEGERPDTISNFYYGSVKYTWLILIANDIIDPYYDWPLFGTDFDNYIKRKYGSIDQSKTTIHHYEKILREEQQIMTDDGLQKIREKVAIIDKETYDEEGGRAVTNFDYEIIEREKKRSIILVDEYYAKNIQNEFRTFAGNL